MIGAKFNLQGHRGARGLAPENTLPSFEMALDAGVSSIETDLHLSRDGIIVLCHEATLGVDQPLISQLTHAELLDRAGKNPNVGQFRDQCRSAVTPLAATLAAARQRDPLELSSLGDLFAFVKAYAGQPGRDAGKSPQQRDRAAQVVLDLELKRVPGRPERIGDTFDGRPTGLLEERMLECARRNRMLDRMVVRSFDHRCVAALKQREPRLSTAVLIAGTAPVAPEELARRAGASIYCPDVDFLDDAQVARLHAAGIAVVPWTVNQPADWERLLSWGVDGITTDYPDRLALFLRQRGVVF